MDNFNSNICVNFWFKYFILKSHCYFISRIFCKAIFKFKWRHHFQRAMFSFRKTGLANLTYCQRSCAKNWSSFQSYFDQTWGHSQSGHAGYDDVVSRTRSKNPCRLEDLREYLSRSNNWAIGLKVFLHDRHNSLVSTKFTSPMDVLSLRSDLECKWCLSFPQCGQSTPDFINSDSISMTSAFTNPGTPSVSNRFLTATIKIALLMAMVILRSGNTTAAVWLC